MLEPNSLSQLGDEIQRCVDGDRALLDRLRGMIRNLGRGHRIQPHAATAISIVGTDGGNNRIQFDPFMVQLIRVVDSSNNEHCLEAISPGTAFDAMRARHLDSSGQAISTFGKMMKFLKVSRVEDLLNRNWNAETPPATWVQDYRELMEWAVLFELVQKPYGSDTLIIFDGPLRSKTFQNDQFTRLAAGIRDAIKCHFDESRRRIFVVGIQKHSAVIEKFRLTMALEGVMRTAFPCYAAVPRELQREAYRYSEWMALELDEIEGTAAERFVAGRMYLAKFGTSPRDPIWGVDLLHGQEAEAAEIFGYLLHDALPGFPIPYYPLSLQKAHENAALVDFDMQMLQDKVLQAFRHTLGDESEVLDQFQLETADVSARRYA